MDFSVFNPPPVMRPLTTVAKLAGFAPRKVFTAIMLVDGLMSLLVYPFQFLFLRRGIAMVRAALCSFGTFAIFATFTTFGTFATFATFGTFATFATFATFSRLFAGHDEV